MPRPYLTTLLLTSVLAPSCTSPPSEPLGPPDDYTLAFYHHDCAPWDGPAISIYLVQHAMTAPYVAPTPHLRVSLYAGLPVLVGRTVEWSGTQSNDGYAARCPTEGPCEPAATASVRIRSWDAGQGRLSGSLELGFADGFPEAGGFEAVRLDFEPICG
jgi:hypothetical protein